MLRMKRPGIDTGHHFATRLAADHDGHTVVGRP